MDGMIPKNPTAGAPVASDRDDLSIAKMPAWFFWSRTIIDGTPEDYAAQERGELDPERKRELAAAGQVALDRLATAPVAGWDEWKPHKMLVH